MEWSNGSIINEFSVNWAGYPIVVIDNQIAMIILMLCLWAAKPR
jgi:hypothetical protein